jgi:hypothetical protein
VLGRLELFVRSVTFFVFVEQGSDEEEAEVPELDDQMGNLDGDQEDHVENLDKQFWEGEDEDEADPKEDEADQVLLPSSLPIPKAIRFICQKQRF